MAVRRDLSGSGDALGFLPSSLLRHHLLRYKALEHNVDVNRLEVAGFRGFGDDKAGVTAQSVELPRLQAGS